MKVISISLLIVIILILIMMFLLQIQVARLNEMMFYQIDFNEQQTVFNNNEITINQGFVKILKELTSSNH